MENQKIQPAEITYNGELTISDQKKPITTTIQVVYKRNKATVSFVYGEELISFSAAQTEQGIRINEKVMDDYILSGVSSVEDPSSSPIKIGKGKQAFSFHIVIDYFSGENLDIYFSGNTGKYIPRKKKSGSQKKSIFKTMMAAMF